MDGMPRFIALLVSIALTGCGPAESSAAQPSAPQVILDQSFQGAGATYRVTVDREVYPPHYAGLLHTHPGPGSLCLLQGQLSMEAVGQQPAIITPGQCWTESPGIAHRPVNTTDTEAVALFYLFAPAGQPRIEPASGASGSETSPSPSPA